MNKDEIVNKTAIWVEWWIEQRKGKLRNELSDTMSINPFMLPILFDLHNINDFGELSDLFVSSHLMVGHNTGFGKLIDEKILPEVFGTQKLDKKFRHENEPFVDSCFNEIDHIVDRGNGEIGLLSLKAGKWTIQLTMAMHLNTAFNEILTKYDQFDEIVVGVFYGTLEGLTDKYDILRGINRGAKHNVIDLTKNVSVHTGRAFWAWLNKDIIETQDWVLEGIIKGVKDSNARVEGGELLANYNKFVADKYQRFIKEDNSIDWHALLTSING